MYKFYLSVVIGLLTSINLQAQFEEHNISKYLNEVIAESGLNMRKAPQLDAEVVTKIPFGARITLMDNKSFGIDTVTIIKTEVKELIIRGHWLKVHYKGKYGYVISSYLRENRPNQYRSKYKDNIELNSDFVLLNPGWDCVDNFVAKKNFYWYGVYQENNHNIIKAIDFEFINSINGYSSFGIIAKDNKNLEYIIGAKKKLKGLNNKITYDYYLTLQNLKNLKRSDTCFVYGERDFYIEYNQAESNSGRVYDYREVEFRKDGITQKLLPLEDQQMNRAIRFIGDLDGDGDPDYIITHGEKQGRVMLYLSSQKNKKYPIAKPVAAYYWSMCC